MGASNVKAAYALWRPRLHPGPFAVLVYMALVARDDSQPPQYFGGREALAIASGRREPFGMADWRAVERHVAALTAAGAVVLSRHSTHLTTARYDLQLRVGSPDAQRGVSSPVDNPVTRHSLSGDHPTLSGQVTRRSVASHPTLSGESPDAQRGPEEEQEPQDLLRGVGGHPPAPVTRARELEAAAPESEPVVDGTWSLTADRDDAETATPSRWTG